jgi:hypothetical protein
MSQAHLLAVLAFLVCLSLTTPCAVLGQNPSFVPQLSWTAPEAYLTGRRTYCSCTYNVHASRTSPPAMFMLGGELNYTNTILTNDIWYSTDGFYADAHDIQPTSLLNVAGANFTHRRAGGAHLLYNGNIIWYGGKTDTTSGAFAAGFLLNSVYYSTDMANTWSQVLTPTAWQPRSDMSYCTAPFTNVAFFAAGSNATN